MSASASQRLRRLPLQRGAVCGAAFAVALLVLAPLLRPGYVLVGDMVFVPDRPLSGALLGLGSAVPRAVPSDLLVALATVVLPGDVVQKLVLVAVLAGAGLGAGLLAPVGTAGRLAAAVAYGWNPFVYERLLLGQWALLVGYAAAPWAVRAALAFRDGEPGAWVRVVLSLAVAACGGGAASLLVVPAVLAVACWPGGRGWRGAGVVVGAAVLVNVPWWLPSVLRPGGVPTDGSAVEVFRARADTPMGLVPSLLSGGGIWDAGSVPPGRDSWALAVPILGLLAVAAIGVVLLARIRRDLVAGLAVVAAFGLLVAVAPSLPLLDSAVTGLVDAVPGGGLLRDGQRMMATWVLLAALGLGAAADRLPDLVTGTRPRMVLAGAIVAAPVAVLPALAWGAAGDLDAVRYPRDWARTAQAVEQDDGAVLVLPWQAYRRFGWNDGRTVSDPATRWFDRPVLASDDLPVAVGDRVAVVRGEDPLAARVTRALDAGEPLVPLARDLGVRHILVERDAGASLDPDLLAGARLVRRGDTLDLYAIDPTGDIDAELADVAPPAAPVVVADVLVVGFLVLCGVKRLLRRAD